jgi:hypothetical protein
MEKRRLLGVYTHKPNRDLNLFKAMIDINELSFQLAKSMEPMDKALPPKINYRFKKWRTKYGAKNLPAQKSELKKNEMSVSLHKNQEVKLAFGAAISDKVKKAAIDWLKKKGLTPKEASLNKSINTESYVILSPAGDNYNGELSDCESSAIFTIDK